MSDISIDGLTASGAPFRIGVVLSKAFSVFSGRLGSFLLLTLIPMIPLLAVKLVVLAGPQKGLPASNAGAIDGLSGILTFFLGIVAQATVLYGAFQQMGGKPFSMGASLGVGLRRSVSVLGVALLSGVATVVATFLLVVPGIIVACMLYVAVPACVIEKEGVISSLDRSAVLTRGHRWQIFALWALVAVIGGVALVVLKLFAGVLLWGTLLTFGWQVITTAFGAVLVAVIYHDLRVTKEGIDIDSLAHVFD